jgi:hypothetical protein
VKLRSALLVGVFALVLVPSAYAVAAFVTPRGGVYCGASEGDTDFTLICWRIRDGYTVWMGQRSQARGQIHQRNKAYKTVAGRKLRHGDAWSDRFGWACVSAQDGVTCTNRAGHGWWLGERQGHRFF